MSMSRKITKLDPIQAVDLFLLSPCFLYERLQRMPVSAKLFFQPLLRKSLFQSSSSQKQKKEKLRLSPEEVRDVISTAILSHLKILADSKNMRTQLPTLEKLALTYRITRKQASDAFEGKGLYFTPRVLSYLGKQPDKTEYNEAMSYLKIIIVKAALKHLKKNFYLPNSLQIAKALNTSKEFVNNIFNTTDKLVQEIRENKRKYKSILEMGEEKLIRAYSQLARRTKTNVTEDEIKLHFKRTDNINITSQLSYFVGKNSLFFNNMNELKQAAMKKNPNAFKSFIDKSVFNNDYIKKMKTSIDKSQGVLVTTAIAGDPVNMSFFRSLLNYARRNQYVILILPSNREPFNLNPVFFDNKKNKVFVLKDDLRLDAETIISNYKVNPNSPKPHTK